MLGFLFPRVDAAAGHGLRLFGHGNSPRLHPVYLCTYLPVGVSVTSETGSRGGLGPGFPRVPAPRVCRRRELCLVVSSVFPIKGSQSD